MVGILRPVYLMPVLSRLKIVTAAAVLCACISAPRAGEAGDAAMPSIALVPAARPSGLAGAHAAVGTGVAALGINPAGLAREPGRTFAGSVRPDLSRVGSVAYAFPGLGGQWAASVSYVDFDAIAQTGEDNAGLGTLRPYNMYPALTYARELGSEWTVGATAKLARETLGDFEGSTPAYGAGFDAGAQYRPEGRRVGLGFALTNAGRQLTGYYEGDSRRGALPAVARAGVFYQPAGRRQTVLTADIEAPLHGEPALVLGGEYRPMREWELRAGTRWNRDDVRNLVGRIDPNSDIVERGGEAARLAGGTTVRVGAVAVDYAAQWWGELGIVHALTVAWSLDER